MPSTNRRLLALIDELLKVHEPAIQRAFIEAMQDARNAVDLQAVIEALVRGDIASAMQAIEFSRAFLAPLDQEIARAYYRAGQGFTGLLMASRPRGVTVTIRFDPGNPRAAGWLREHSSTLVTEIVEDQRVAVRAALAAGMEAGRNPRIVALDVVGRMDKVAKQRTGGVIGLTSQQAQWVENARTELASGDPAQMRNYFTRKARDKKSDRLVMRAIREGRPVPAADVTRILARYSDGLLEYRGRVVGRTESLTALSYGQDESARQLLDASGLRSDQIERTWIARLDGRTRDAHVAMHEKKVPLDGTFTSPATGARMRFPRDTQFGAHGEDVIQCRCVSSLAVRWGGAR